MNPLAHTHRTVDNVLLALCRLIISWIANDRDGFGREPAVGVLINGVSQEADCRRYN